MLRLAGTYGDGWYPFAVATPDDYAARLAIVREAARDAGRDPEAITPALHAITIVAPTESEARAMLESRPVRFIGLLFPDAVWQLFGRSHPLGEDFRGFLDIIPDSYDRQTLDAAVDAVPMELLELLFWGTPDQLVDRFRALGGAGLRHIVPMLASPLVSQEAAAYAMDVMPRIAHALRTGTPYQAGDVMPEGQAAG